MSAAKCVTRSMAQRLRPVLRRAVAVAAISAALLCAPAPLSDLQCGPQFQGCAKAVSVDKEVKTAENNPSKSYNWAGYVVGSSINDPAHTVDSVSATWKVQDIALSKDDTYSMQWTGIGGVFGGDTTLIQAGTASDCEKGKKIYYAWYDLIPDELVKIKGVVRPGDSVSVYISMKGEDRWRIVLSDSTRNWSFDTEVDYKSSRLSAEWIEERTTKMFGAGGIPEFTDLADFGTAQFGNEYTGHFGNYASIGNDFRPIGAWPHLGISMNISAQYWPVYRKTGKPFIITPSALSGGGSSFSVKFVGERDGEAK